jgi:hypothetical protein
VWLPQMLFPILSLSTLMPSQCGYRHISNNCWHFGFKTIIYMYIYIPFYELSISNIMISSF